MAGRPIIALVSLILLAGGVLFEFFIVLNGGSGYSTPENRLFFLSVNTAGIPNAPASPRVGWTYYGLASMPASTVGTGTVTQFLGVHPCYPFDPVSNFGLSGSQLNSIPPDFVNTNYYYYMSRFAWVFYLIALFFAVLGLFTGVLALCSRIGGYLSGLMLGIATFFMGIAAALMTAWTVRAKNAFNGFNGNANAALGQYMYGFSWAAFACYFIAMVLFCVSGASSGRKETTYKEKKGMFGRSKSTRSAGGVKSEYS